MNYICSIIWDVSPEIIEGFHVRWYGLLFAVGFMLAYYVLSLIFKKENIEQKILDNITFYAFLGTIIGARLGHCLFYQPDYYLSNPIDILKIWEGGLASHGGTIGVIVAFFILSKKYKLDYLWILSRTSVVIPITAGFIRMGNLMNSEIYGTYTNLPWGFIFVHDGQTIPMHPTQIYEALAYFIIFGINFLYYNKALKKENIQNEIPIGIILLGIFLSRFLIEFFKNIQVDFEETMFFNMGQLLSVPFIIAGIILIVIGYKKKQKISSKKL